MVPAPDHALLQPVCTVSKTVYNNSNAGVTGAEEVTVDKVITVSTSKSSRRRRKVPTRLVRNQKPAEVERVRVVEQVTHVYSLGSVPQGCLARITDLLDDSLFKRYSRCVPKGKKR